MIPLWLSHVPYYMGKAAPSPNTSKGCRPRLCAAATGGQQVMKMLLRPQEILFLRVNNLSDFTPGELGKFKILTLAYKSLER